MDLKRYKYKQVSLKAYKTAEIIERRESTYWLEKCFVDLNKLYETCQNPNRKQVKILTFQKIQVIFKIGCQLDAKLNSINQILIIWQKSLKLEIQKNQYMKQINYNKQLIKLIQIAILTSQNRYQLTYEQLN